MLFILQPIAATLKKARRAKHLSQRTLADQLGIPQGHLSKIERGAVNLRLASLVEMARRLDLEVMLIPREDVSLVKELIVSKETGRGGEGIGPAYTLDDEEEK